MRTWKAGLFAALTLGLVQIAAAQMAPRENYGALLEPNDKVIHGAGQSSDAFRDYWNAMPESGRPAVFMYYTGVNSLSEDWSLGLKEDLDAYAAEGRFVIPQIGLSMTSDGNPNAHYEDDVASGAMDDRIANLVEGFRKLGYPAYLRIGYEFNGLTWNGYRAPDYREAYKRITDALRAANLEVATVWCASVDGEDNYYSFYPGDDYVDWWGIDIFSAEHFDDANGLAFMDSARVHQKPVMLGETTPRYVGAEDAADWDAWFVPFFGWLDGQPGAKMISYINWDWAEWSARLGTNWTDWGDARIDRYPATRVPYTDRLSADAYLHAEAERDFRQRLGHADSEAPVSVSGLRQLEGAGVHLDWDLSTDPSGIAHYFVYKDGTQIDRTLSVPYHDRAAEVGSANYQVAAVDRAGNVGPLSDAVTVMTASIEQIRNGEFDEGADPWTLDVFDSGGNATLLIDPASHLSGPNSARISLLQSTGTDWHIQLRQFFHMTEGASYTIRFRAKANREVTFPVLFQEVADPYTIYLNQMVTVGTTENAYELTYSATDSNQIALTFFLGAVGGGRIWIDSVSVEASAPGSTGSVPSPGSELVGQSVELGYLHPNPARSGGAVSITLDYAAPVRMEMLDILGRRVWRRDFGTLSAGEHRIVLDLADLVPGTYLLALRGPLGTPAKVRPFIRV